MGINVERGLHVLIVCNTQLRKRQMSFNIYVFVGVANYYGGLCR